MSRFPLRPVPLHDLLANAYAHTNWTFEGIDTSAHTGSLGLAFGATAAALPFKANYVGTNCPPSGEQTIACTFGLLEGPGHFPSPLGDGMSIGPIAAFAIAFDPQFKLLKKKHTDATTGGTLTVEWTADVVPISPPK